MNTTSLAAAAAAAAIALSIGAAAPASATDNIQPFGTLETLNDFFTGAPTIGYTVMDLIPSSDAVPHNGQLYEATVTNSGGVPMSALFNARAESGQLYRTIGGGIPGKIYFDVVGDVPNSVVYNDGVRDLLAWVGTSRTAAPGGAPTSGDTSTGGNGGAPGGSGGNAQLGPFAPPDTGANGGNGGSGNGITGSDQGGGGLGGASGTGGG
jgi:hypothetical protein